MGLLVLSWPRYVNLLRESLEWLNTEKIVPEVVVGIARDGLVPATMLAEYFRTRAIGVAYVQKTASDEPFSEMLPKAVCQGFYCPVPINGKDLLLVDCIIQTGQTVRCVLDIAETMRPSRITVISICTHQGSWTFRYFSPLMVQPDDWVIFPWEGTSLFASSPS